MHVREILCNLIGILSIFGVLEWREARFAVKFVLEFAVVQIQKAFEDELTTEQKASFKFLLKLSVQEGEWSENGGAAQA